MRALPIAGVDRFEQAAVDALKSLVLACFKNAAHLASAPWLPANLRQEGSDGSAALCAGMLACVRYSEHWQSGVVKARWGGCMHAGAASPPSRLAGNASPPPPPHLRSP